MNHGSLFSGIGGFDLASEWMGWNNVFHCEINPFGKQVLKYYWPNAISYDDITKTDFTIHRGNIDILTGGFPCQPFSVAGNRKGEDDNRFLWPHMLRAIKEIKPRWVVAENVTGIITMDNGKTLERILDEMENEGYKTEIYNIPACSVGAWHKRERIWIIANSIDSSYIAIGTEKNKEEEIQGKHWKKGCSWMSVRTDNALYTNGISQRSEGYMSVEIPELRGIQRRKSIGIFADIGGRPDLSTPVICRSYDGISKGMDRVTAYGNAIVPQVALQIFKAIEEYEKLIK